MGIYLSSRARCILGLRPAFLIWRTDSGGIDLEDTLGSHATAFCPLALKMVHGPYSSNVRYVCLALWGLLALSSINPCRMCPMNHSMPLFCSFQRPDNVHCVTVFIVASVQRKDPTQGRMSPLERWWCQVHAAVVSAEEASNHFS